jgi:hypothetical protein
MEGADLKGCGKQEASERVRDSETQNFLLREFDRITRSLLRPEWARLTANGYVG